MNVLDELRASHEREWEAMVRHPFVLDLGNGTLPAAVFAEYMAQDYLFIDGLTRLVATGIAKAPNVNATQPLGGFLQTLLGAEDALFRDVFTRLGVPWSTVHLTRPLPVTKRFVAFLTSTARKRFVDIVTLLYVTEGTYADWAGRLAAEGRLPDDPLYRGWIDIHADQSLVDLVDYLAACIHEAPDRDGIEGVFARTLRLETAFWDAVYPPRRREGAQ